MLIIFYSNHMDQILALVAERIRHLFPKEAYAGSNPVESTNANVAQSGGAPA